jgi:hypothetical protein
MEYLALSGSLLLLGAVAIYFTYKKAYDKGITTAILLHRNGRLKYKDYYDENGEKMVDIEIAPLEDEE